MNLPYILVKPILTQLDLHPGTSVEFLSSEVGMEQTKLEKFLEALEKNGEVESHQTCALISLA